MYLERGRSSRFKLLKSLNLAYKLKKSNKNPGKSFQDTLSKNKYNEPQKRKLEQEPSTNHVSLEDSETFVSNFLEFSDILSSRLLKSLESNGFVKITPIQKCSIPKILEGSTVLIRSPSGTGKTLTFLVPALERLISPKDNRKITRKDGTKVLIITPTRELSFQISKVAEDLSKPFPWIVVSCIKGGESRKSEKARIRKGITVVIGTPGRVLDHMESTSSFNLENLEMLVLDEADRLLDMGFESKIRTIHSHLLDAKVSNRENSGIQIVLTSATITERIRKLVDSCLVSKPLMIGVNEENHKIPKKLNLEYILVDCNNKFMSLVSLLLKFVRKREKIMVFVSNCDTVRYMELLLRSLTWPTLEKKIEDKEKEHQNQNLNQKQNPIKNRIIEHDKVDKIFKLNNDKNWNSGINSNTNSGKNLFKVPIFKLHGDMESKERMECMESFIKSECSILVSTDVASRGLNLSKVNRVIQYDPPQQVDEFIHRSGRTARIGEEGTCVMILINHEKELVDLLNKKGLNLNEINQESLWLETKENYTPKYFKKFKGDLVGFIRNRFCMEVKSNQEMFEMAKNAFKSSIRSYKTYSKELRKIFNFRELHLGHYATSFCLNVKPTELLNHNKQGENQVGQTKKRKNQSRQHSDRPLKEPKVSLSSESEKAAEMALKYLKENNMIL